MAPSSSDDDLEAQRVNIFLHAENVRIFKSTEDRQLPVTIVTGFLGSGKTTLLNHILSNKSNLRVAAAINDFAELNIDASLVQQQREGKIGGSSGSSIIQLSNGCVCCHLLDDLKEVVWSMLDPNTKNKANNGSNHLDVDSVNYLVIETSGISDPAEIIRTLDAKFGKCFRARLDSVVTVVDADQLLGSPSGGSTIMDSQAGLAQLRCADVVLINKMDLLKDSPGTQEEITTRIKELIESVNATATLQYTSHCKIPLSTILDVEIPSTNNAGSASTPISHEASHVPIYVSATGGALRSTASSMSAVRAVSKFDPHLQVDKFVSTSATHSDRPLALYKLQKFVTSPMVVQNLARMKGVLWIQGGQSKESGCRLQDYRCVIHLSGRGRLGFALDGRWSGPPKSEMAFIARSVSGDGRKIMEDIEAEFAKCLVGDTDSSDDDGDQMATNSIETRSKNLTVMQNQPEFALVETVAYSSLSLDSVVLFRLTGKQVYGYTEEEIERDLRIDADAMNQDLVDAVNASVDVPKAFLTYAYLCHMGPNDNVGKNETRLVLCFDTRAGEPANNFQVLVREAKTVLASHFRNVQVCKCGA